MQAGVDAGCAAGRGDQLARIDIEHVRVHQDVREAFGQFRCVAPVRGGAATVEQTGGGQHEHPRADRQQPRAPGMGLAQGGQQLLGYCSLAVAPAGNDDGPRLLQQFQAAIGQYLDATHGAHRALIDGRDLMAVPREVELRPGQAKDLHGDAEFEGT
ncbi:hypothetical protein D9M73_194560 [compost metagenome]